MFYVVICLFEKRIKIVTYKLNRLILQLFRQENCYSKINQHDQNDQWAKSMIKVNNTLGNKRKICINSKINRKPCIF